MDFNRGWTFYIEGEREKKQVDLPHDAMIDGKRAKDALSGSGGAYFEGGIYHYSKEFDVPAEWAQKHLCFEFEGVYRKPKIYINGALAYEWAYGYTGFCFCADKFLKYGEKNSIEVVADNSEMPNSRWYTGGGIYRPVRLYLKNQAHFLPDGICVKTRSVSPAVIELSAEHTSGEVRFEIYDGDKKVASLCKDRGEVTIEDAKLWSDESPYLYTLKATLSDNGETRDEEEISFGIRTVEWSAKGFFVNGKNVLLRGGCVHHDNGILGARCYAEAEERKVRIIKESGFNAIRSSHNPCSKAFVSACDKYGVYLIDELSDMWYMRKKKYDYALDFEKWHERDVMSIVKKDRNHPSVVMYSIGNEVSEPFEQRGVETAKHLVSLFKSLDDRPVTAGINLFIIGNAAKGKGQYSEEKVEADAAYKPQSEKPTSSTLFNMIASHAGPSMNKMANSDRVDKIASPVLDCLDIAGYNYASGRYEMEGKKHPSRVIFGSETFPQDIYRNWEKVKRLPYLIGDFMWTAIDYLGEVGLGGWSYEPQYGMTFGKPYPWIIADSGAIDLIGDIGAEAKYAAVVWGLEHTPYIGVRPVRENAKKLVKQVWRGTNAVASWSWQGCEGRMADVEVYSDAAYVELRLNRKKLGVKKVKECKALFKTTYHAGELVAVALDKEKREVSRSSLVSAKKELQISITPEQPAAKVGEIVFLDVSLTDGNGIVESNADTKLKIETNGELLAFGSAEQKSEERYSSDQTVTHYGRALAAVRVIEGGWLTVKVSGKNLHSEITIGEEETK